jgi:hypothetical protein
MVISLLLLCNIAKAQDFKNITQGDVAPFTGTILTPESIAKIITIEDAKLKTCNEQWQHEVNTVTINKDTEIDKLKHDLKITEETKNKIIDEKEKEISRTYDLVKKQNRNLTPLWLGVGFTAGFITSFATIYGYETIIND